jgi:hypothetical protein
MTGEIAPKIRSNVNALTIGKPVAGGGPTFVLYQDASSNLSAGSTLTFTGSSFVIGNAITIFTNGDINNLSGLIRIYGSTGIVLRTQVGIGTSGDCPAGTTPLTVAGNASQTAPLVVLEQKSSTSTLRNAGVVDATLATATDASWKGRLVLYAGDFSSSNAGQREGVRVESDGTQPLLGFYGHAAVAKASTPVTLADVISLLQNIGLCS